MRINLVNGATYFPAKITPRLNVSIQPKMDNASVKNTPARADAAQFENINPREMDALQKLFGELKNNSIKQNPGSAQPGQFIDITI
jgi:hypothetical protein